MKPFQEQTLDIEYERVGEILQTKIDLGPCQTLLRFRSGFERLEKCKGLMRDRSVIKPPQCYEVCPRRNELP